MIRIIYPPNIFLSDINKVIIKNSDAKISNIKHADIYLYRDKKR